MKTLDIASQPPATIEALKGENEELRRRLEEAEETIAAIRSGAIDALVVEEPEGHRIYTLEGAERPYRLFVEEMQQGAATLHFDGTIAWCNRQLAHLLKTPQEKLLGALLRDFITSNNHAAYDNLLWQGQTRSGRGEAQLRRSDGGLVPSFLTFNALPKDCGAAIGVLVTDLTTQRHHEQLTAAHSALRQAEQELREFLENASVAIHWVGPDGIILWANQAELNLLGYAREEYVGRHIGEFHVDADNINGILQCLSAGQTLHEHPARLRSKDGSIRHVMIDSNVLWEGGKFIHTRCFTRDITARKQAEEELRKASEFDEAVMANMGEGLYTVDGEGRVTYVNPAAEKFFGWTSAELLGRRMHDVTHYKHPDGTPFPAEECSGFQVLKHGKNLTDQEDVFIRKDGTFFHVVYSSSPLREGHEIVGLVVVFRDVSSRKRAEEDLQAAQIKLQQHARELEARVAERTAELQATNNQLETFVYSIAHDLRAPLRSMQGFSELLAKDTGSSLSDAGRDYTNRISRSAHFMDDLLQDLLAFSQLAQQGIQLTAVNLETLVRSALSRLEKEIQEKNAQVELIGRWPAVLAHEPTLGQVISNLLSNALKFVAPGVVPVVRVRAQEWTAVASTDAEDKVAPLSGKWVRVWVEDNGIGIAPEHQRQVFRLFERLNGNTYGGTGLGLAIVQKGIERMGGRVGVESNLGRGSQFWFELRKA